MGIVNTELKIMQFSRDNGREVFSAMTTIFNFSMKIKIVYETNKK